MSSARRLTACAAILFASPSFWYARPAIAEKLAEPISKGQPAPFDGQVLTTELAVALGLKAERCDTETDLFVQRAERLCRIDVLEQVRLREIDREAWKQKQKLYERRLSFWESREMGVILGIVGTLVAIVVADALEDRVLSDVTK